MTTLGVDTPTQGDDLYVGTIQMCKVGVVHNNSATAMRADILRGPQDKDTRATVTPGISGD